MHYAYTPFIWLSLVLGTASLADSVARRFDTGWGKLYAPFFVAAAGVTAEWLTGFSPLPVGVALTQYQILPIIQIASLTGVWGVSFLLYLVNAAVAEVLLSGKAARKPLVISSLLLFAAFVFGVGELFSWGMRQRYGKPERLTVAATQDYNGADGGVDALKGSPDVPDSDVLTRQAAAQGAHLVVGTENALGITFNPADPTDEVYKQARNTGAHLVVGFESRDQPRPYNCAALVSPDGKTLGIHHKIQLFLGERQAMRAGTSATAYPSVLGKIGVLICFDSCFTAYARQSVRDGAQLLAIPNYDPPTPRAVLHHLHTALMPFRAVENRVALVRSEPNGLSCIVNPSGQIVASAPMYHPASVVATVELGDGRGTWFTRFGDWFAYGCAAFVVTLLARFLRGTRTAVKEPVPQTFLA